VTEAVRRGVWLEINASPSGSTCTAPSSAPPKPRARGFTISTDAHHPKHLANVKYGVLTARRGWLGPADIMNTRDATEFAHALKTRP